MTASDSTIRRVDQRKRSWRTMWISISLLLLIPILVCGGAATWFLGRQSAAQAELDARMAELAERGEPYDQQSMARFVEARTSDEYQVEWLALETLLIENGYAKASRDMPFHSVYGDESPATVPRPGEPWPDRDRVDDFLKKYRKELADLMKLAIHEATGVDKPLRRRITFDGISTPLQSTDKLRDMSSLLMLQHAVAVFDEDTNLAFKCIEANQGLERSTFGEPLMISQSMGGWMATNTNRMIQRSLKANQLSDQQMSEIAGRMVEYPQARELFEMAIKGEVGTMLPMFSNPHQVQQVTGSTSPGSGNFLSKTRATDALFYFESMRAFTEFPSDLEPLEFLDRVNDESALLRSELSRGGAINRIDHSMSRNMVPSVDGFANAMIQRVEQNRLVKAAMALRSYEKKFARWPDSLEQLSGVGANPEDFKMVTGDPLGFRIDDDGDAIVWGFQRADRESVPSDPPAIDGDQNSGNRIWVWRLKR